MSGHEPTARVRLGKCCLCGGTGKPVATYAGWRFDRCTTCDLVFAADTPRGNEISSAELTAPYESEDYFQDYVADTNDYRRELVTALQTIRRYVGGGVFCDIGCSIGTALGIARDHGFSPVGVELSAFAAERARRNCNCRVVQGSVFDEAFLDLRDISVLFLNHVLEHFPDPLTALRRMITHLRPDGIVWINVPTLSLHRRFISALGRVHCLGLGEHFTWFNRNSLRRTLAHCELEPVHESGDFIPWNPKLLPVQLVGRLVRSYDSIAVVAGRRQSPAD